MNHSVRLGRLNHINGPAVYEFPNRKSALLFGKNESALHPKRVVIVRDPSGHTIKRYGQVTRKKSAA